ncbi:sulfatase [Thalassoglobus sp. JC818]|uniref:sulfatase family protein n=1 Tax=Thalassoglobus sp. JC818 TaxID=3232136 RepID=UPI0034582F3D
MIRNIRNCWAILLLCCSVSFASDDRPNILFIVSEDNGPELGCYGDPYAKTPHLDQLAASGVLFQRAFVPQAGCSQSRASFLTGLYPHQHGQIGLATWGFRLTSEETPNLPRSLKQAGYRTGLIGKLHINPKSAFPFDLHEIPSSNFARKNLSEYAQHAESFMSEDDKPFFLSVNYPDAHAPWIRQIEGSPEQPQSANDVQVIEYMGINPPGLRELVANHYNCMSRLDSLIGDLLAALERSGKSENTIVIYFGDHGADFLRGKRTSYEGGLRVPLLMRWPGKIAPQVRDELVSTIDLMPTLLEASQADPVKNLPGESLLPLLSEEDAQWREYFCAEYHTHAAAPNYFPQRSIRNARYKLIESLLPNTIHPDYSVTIQKLNQVLPAGSQTIEESIEQSPTDVHEAYKLMEQPPRYQLYDLQSDPHEFHNLAGDPKHAETLNDLKEHLEQWRAATNDPLLDQQILNELTNEVQSVKSKSKAKNYDWKYPDHFARHAASK